MVEPRPRNCYIPLMHEVVSGVLSPSAIEFDAGAFCRAIGATHIRQSAERLDAVARTVSLCDGTVLPYDRLIITVGSVPDLTSDAAAAGIVYGAKFLDDALRMRARIAALRAGGRTRTHVAIIGTGITGVEWAAELAGRGVDGLPVAVTLVGRSPRILPELSPGVARHAARRLERLGVSLALDRQATAFRADGITLDGSTELPCDLVVWAGGVRPAPVVRALGLPLTADGHLVVTPRLTVPGHPAIVAAGDAVRIMEPEAGCEWPTAVRAIEAIWQGAYLARALGHQRSADDGPPYRFRRTFFYGVSLGPGRSMIVYDRWWLDTPAFVLFRRWLEWAYYARLRILAHTVGSPRARP